MDLRDDTAEGDTRPPPGRQAGWCARPRAGVV